MLAAAFVAIFLSTGPAGASCTGCSCRGGPGFRMPNGKCASWKQVKNVCGVPYSKRCTDERPASKIRQKPPQAELPPQIVATATDNCDAAAAQMATDAAVAWTRPGRGPNGYDGTLPGGAAVMHFCTSPPSIRFRWRKAFPTRPEFEIAARAASIVMPATHAKLYQLMAACQQQALKGSLNPMVVAGKIDVTCAADAKGTGFTDMYFNVGPERGE